MGYDRETQRTHMTPPPNAWKETAHKSPERPLAPPSPPPFTRTLFSLLLFSHLNYYVPTH